jgi:hypothetical protein
MVDEILDQSIIPLSRRKADNRRVIDGDSIRMDSHRYWTFKMKGTHCVCCGIEGVFFAKEKHLESDNRFHFNLYGLDEFGNEVLMTKDHIMPKSKGGKDHIDNYQTMCVRCNVAKGDKLPHEYNGGQKVNCS